MEQLALTLKSLPSMQQRLGFIEKLVADDPNDVTGWLYLADYYLYVDLEKTIHAWEQIARLRPTDECVQYALHSIRELNQGLVQ